MVQHMQPLLLDNLFLVVADQDVSVDVASRHRSRCDLLRGASLTRAWEGGLSDRETVRMVAVLRPALSLAWPSVVRKVFVLSIVARHTLADHPRTLEILPLREATSSESAPREVVDR